jgi:lipoate-protein ligase A
MTTTGFEVESSRGAASVFHAREVADPAMPVVWAHEVDRPALVLGSNQDDAVVDVDECRRHGAEVVRRRSGGGAVLLRPGEVGWIDVVVPHEGPGWTPDVQQQMVWLGARLVRVLTDLGGIESGRLHVHEGPMVRTEWSTTICFDGIGAGEVLLDGAKLVGISQRRTRGWARLQCSWHVRYDPAELLTLLHPEHRPRREALMPVAVLPPSARTHVASAAVATALAPLLTA